MASADEVALLEHELDMILRRIEVSTTRCDEKHRARMAAPRNAEDRWGVWKREEEAEEGAPPDVEDPEVAAAKAAFRELSSRIDAHVAALKETFPPEAPPCAADVARAAAEKERLRQVLLKRDAAAKRYAKWLTAEAHLRHIRRTAVLAIVAVAAALRADREEEFAVYLASEDCDTSVPIPASPTKRTQVLGELLELRDLKRRALRFKQL
eukprot:TRINITY_DN19773_c0_g2_i1.p1 TRINITY_DN19773_c0_g2~~TRINITY_DN19773_c0_g2_i1.p1  ORF type:complete len:210 (+),score=63.22 TRINITY_DN19773_c0_g2_i1:51-680(+)